MLTPHIIRVLDLTEDDLRAVQSRARTSARRASRCFDPDAGCHRRRRPRCRHTAAADRRRQHRAPGRWTVPAPRRSPSTAMQNCRRRDVQSDSFDVRAERRAGAPPDPRSRARRFRSRARCSRPSAASAAAMSAMPERMSRLSSVRPRSCVGPVTMMRCGSHRNRSARIALSCSSANRRSSYIQSCTSVVPCACVREHGHEADDVAREAGPEAGRDAARAVRASTAARRTGRPRDRSPGPSRPARRSIGSRSTACAPVTSTSPPVTAPTTRPGRRLDVVAAQRVRGAAQLRRRLDADRRRADAVDARRPSPRGTAHSSATCGSQAALRISVTPFAERRGRAAPSRCR